MNKNNKYYTQNVIQMINKSKKENPAINASDKKKQNTIKQKMVY